jgi:hypothetical protein
MKADAKPTFIDVAKLIIDPPLVWLIIGLGYFDDLIREPATSVSRADAADEIDRMKNAIRTLRRLLPAFLHAPVVSRAVEADVLDALGALTKIQPLVERANLRPGKRVPEFGSKCCAEVIVEASRMVLGEAQPRSEVLTYSACDAYYQACDNQSLGDIENWRRPVKRAMTADTTWIRDIFQRCQNLQIDPK